MVLHPDMAGPTGWATLAALRVVTAGCEVGVAIVVGGPIVRAAGAAAIARVVVSGPNRRAWMP